jgi:hypothetical protein
MNSARILKHVSYRVKLTVSGGLADRKNPDLLRKAQAKGHANRKMSAFSIRALYNCGEMKGFGKSIKRCTYFTYSIDQCIMINDGELGMTVGSARTMHRLYSYSQ